MVSYYDMLKISNFSKEMAQTVLPNSTLFHKKFQLARLDLVIFKQF